jgi:hypothetical protein
MIGVCYHYWALLFYCCPIWSLSFVPSDQNSREMMKHPPQEDKIVLWLQGTTANYVKLECDVRGVSDINYFSIYLIFGFFFLKTAKGPGSSANGESPTLCMVLQHPGTLPDVTCRCPGVRGMEERSPWAQLAKVTRPPCELSVYSV